MRLEHENDYANKGVAGAGLGLGSPVQHSAFLTVASETLVLAV